MNARQWTSLHKPGFLARLVLLAMLVVPVHALAVEDVPAPAPRPERAGDNAAPGPEPAPVPEERPEQPGDAAAPVDAVPEDRPDQPNENTESLDPKDVPKPLARPDQPEDDAKEVAKPGQDGKEKPGQQDKGDVTIETSNMPLPRPSAMPAEEAACRVRLKELGVAFEERPQLADASGCSAPWPVAVTTLSADVKLQPEAVMNCAAAERAATFLKDHISPKAKSILGSELTSIRQVSAYVCRPRNGTHKLSEHAFGNALDIGAFVLKDGRSVAVGGATKRAEGEFMLAVRLAACGPFTTVLGPGSDADHAAHFHFDLAKRRPGSTFCQ